VAQALNNDHPLSFEFANDSGMTLYFSRWEAGSWVHVLNVGDGANAFFDSFATHPWAVYTSNYEHLEMIFTMDWADFNEYKLRFYSWEGKLLLSTFGSTAVVEAETIVVADPVVQQVV